MAADPQEIIDRLSAKPGVQATLVLSRKDGAVIKSSGFPPSDAAEDASPKDSQSSDREQNWKSNSNAPDDASNPRAAATKQRLGAEETAREIFKYVSETGSFVDRVSAVDDVQLLRVRTKKHEIVIVPDQNYLMVVFQDVPKSA